MKGFALSLLLVFLTGLVPANAEAATKTHVIVFGRWMAVPWSLGVDESKPQTMKVRPLIVDGRVREYVLGAPHDVTDRLFVARRIFRVNDSLPEEPNPRWLWQRGGWLLVDRSSGKISAINLPEFDPLYSAISWYRDYAAYCGISDDGKKTYAMVVQMSRRKPVVKKLLAGEAVAENAAPDSACAAPGWQRNPTQVRFEAPGGAKQTYAVRGHIVDVVADDDADEEASK